MTEAEAEALGKRLVACKGFRPLRGMLDMQGRTWGADLLFRWSVDAKLNEGLGVRAIAEHVGRHWYVISTYKRVKGIR